MKTNILISEHLKYFTSLVLHRLVIVMLNNCICTLCSNCITSDGVIDIPDAKMGYFVISQVSLSTYTILGKLHQSTPFNYNNSIINKNKQQSLHSIGEDFSCSVPGSNCVWLRQILTSIYIITKQCFSIVLMANFFYYVILVCNFKVNQAFGLMWEW